MNHLKKITPEAKKLYKTGRYKKYSDAVKAAFAKNPVKHKKSTGTKKATHKNKVSHRPKFDKSVHLGVGTISGHEASIRKLLKEQLGRCYVSRDFATKKTEKRKYQKDISTIKRKLRFHSK